MSDYIKREDAIKAIEKVTWYHFNEVLGKMIEGANTNVNQPYYKSDDIFKAIDAIPTADVVKVVRCKDCKHHGEVLNNNDGKVLCWVHDIDVIVDRNDYCSYGERKDE